MHCCVVCPVFVVGSKLRGTGSKKCTKIFQRDESGGHGIYNKRRNFQALVLIFAGIHGDERACPVVAAKYSNIRLKREILLLFHV